MDNRKTQEVNDFTFIKKEIGKTIEIRTTKGPPKATQELRAFRYKGYKNLAKLLINCETHYYGTKRRTQRNSHMRNM